MSAAVPETGNEERRKKIPVIGEKPLEAERNETKPNTEQIPKPQDSKEKSQQPRTPQKNVPPQPKRPVKTINTNLQWQMTGLPRIYDGSNVFEVIANDDFIINDLAMTGTKGDRIRWTTIYVTLYGHKQSLAFSVRNGVLKYRVISGEAWISINNKGQVIGPDQNVIVEEGETHKFFNNSKTEPVKFVCDYAGVLDLRKYIEVENAVIEG